MGNGKVKGNATAKFAGDALVLSNRLDGSPATIVAVPDAGCECIQQCGHGPMGTSKATGSPAYSVVSCSGEFSGIESTLDFGGTSTSISIPAISCRHEDRCSTFLGWRASCLIAQSRFNMYRGQKAAAITLLQAPKRNATTTKMIDKDRFLINLQPKVRMS